jgi:hypothetical protein
MANAIGGISAGARKSPSRICFPLKLTRAKTFAGKIVRSKVKIMVPNE